MTKNKLNKKDAIHELSIALGEKEVAQERINEIKNTLKDDYGNEESGRIVKLAGLLQGNKFDKLIEDTNALDELNQEIFGG